MSNSPNGVRLGLNVLTLVKSILIDAKISSLIAAYIKYPMDTVRKKMMMQAAREKVQYNNNFDCIMKLFTWGGIKIFYKGAGTNLIRGIASSLALVFYDYL